MAEKWALGDATREDQFAPEEKDASANESSICYPGLQLVKGQVQRPPLCKRKDTSSCLSKTHQVSRKNMPKATINTEPPDPVPDQEERTGTDVELLAKTKWQPLSINALSDFPSVTHRTVSGHGQFNHGRQHLWKQDI